LRPLCSINAPYAVVREGNMRARQADLDHVLAIDPAGPVDWLELGGRAGYYDQAHFGHDFRTFTGLTPTRYLDLRRRFLREHPGHALDVGPLPAD
jgi:AraC-like DNA-binding protein